MRPSFFIFSLPRSGSAWLSLFLTGPDSYCYHEPIADIEPQEWKARATARPEKTGAVCTGSYCFAPKIWDLIPRAHFFALCREPADIQRSLRWQHIDHDSYREREKLDALRHERILYSRFDDIGYLEEVWARVIGTDFDRERARNLMEMHVERDVQKFLAAHPNALAHFAEMLH